MPKVTNTRHITIELSEKDWSKLGEVYNMLNNLVTELADVDLELDSPEVTYKDCSEEDTIGDQLEIIYNALDELFYERSGMY